MSTAMAGSMSPVLVPMQHLHYLERWTAVLTARLHEMPSGPGMLCPISGPWTWHCGNPRALSQS